MLDVEQAIQLIMQRFGLSHDQVRAAYVGMGPNGQPIFNPGPLQAAGANLGGAGGAGGAGGIGGELQKLLNEANAANESRYQEALGVNATSKTDQLSALDSGYGSLLGTLDAGTSEARQRSDMRADEDESNLKADLSSRGLYNTTILNRDRENIRDRQNLREREITADNAQRQIGVRSHFTDSRVGIIGGSDRDRERLIESKSDIAPDLSLYAQLLSQPGGAGGGGYGQFMGGGGGGHHAPSGFANPLRPPAFERPSAGANWFPGRLPTVGQNRYPNSPYTGDQVRPMPANPTQAIVRNQRPRSPYVW